MAIRYKRLEETLADVQKASRRSERNANRPTGTEVAQTKDTAIQAAADSTFAKDLAEQLQTELGPLPGQIQDALEEAGDALTEAGLARSEAATAVSDASQAAADASQAIQDALAAATLAGGSNTWADRAPVVADGDGKPVGAVWFEYDTAGLLAAMWELRPLGWVQRALDETIIPQVAIGTGTYGSLSGSRLVARSILAEHIVALAITANELAANSVVAVKIAADAVTAEKINAGAVTTVKLDALAVTAEKIAVGAIIAEKIAAEAITAGKIAATAIDGMTITGATVRTAPSGQRIQLDTFGLRSFNMAGVVTASLQSSTGGFDFSGDSNWKASSTDWGIARIRPATTTDSAQFQVLRHNVINILGVSAPIPGSPGLPAAGYLRAAGGDLSLQGDIDVRIKGQQAVRVEALSEIVLDAPKVTFQGDATGVVTPSSGWAVYTGHARRLTRMNGMCFLNVTLQSTGGGIANMGTVPTAFRPSEATFIGTVRASTGTLVGQVYLEPSGKLSIPYFVGSADTGSFYGITGHWHI